MIIAEVALHVRKRQKLESVSLSLQMGEPRLKADCLTLSFNESVASRKKT